MKRILYVRTAPYDLNINSYNVQEIGLGRAFCRLGYDVDIIVFKKRNPKQFVIFECGNNKMRLIEKKRFRWLRWGINTEICTEKYLAQYDYVISAEYMQLETFLLSRKAKRMYVYNGPYYNLFMFKWTSPVFDALFTKRLNANVECIFTKSVLSEQFLVNKGYKFISTVGVGLDMERFDNETTIKPETQKIVDFMRNNKCLLYVGALSQRKNYPFLLNVYEKLLDYDANIKFVVIGKSVVGAFEKLAGIKNQHFEKKCVKNISDRVKNGIYRVEKIDNPQLKFIYPYAKAFLLPSKLEIFGMVLLEAMYLGAPVVTSKNGGSMTLINGKNTGQMVEEFDVNKWCDAIIKYLKDEKYAEHVAYNAHELVLKQYNWHSIAKKMISVMSNSL